LLFCHPDVVGGRTDRSETGIRAEQHQRDALRVAGQQGCAVVGAGQIALARDCAGQSSAWAQGRHRSLDRTFALVRHVALEADVADPDLSGIHRPRNRNSTNQHDHQGDQREHEDDAALCMAT